LVKQHTLAAPVKFYMVPKVQMLEVAGDLHWASAKFENPDLFNSA